MASRRAPVKHGDRVGVALDAHANICSYMGTNDANAAASRPPPHCGSPTGSPARRGGAPSCRRYSRRAAVGLSGGLGASPRTGSRQPAGRSCIVAARRGASARRRARSAGAGGGAPISSGARKRVRDEPLDRDAREPREVLKEPTLFDRERTLSVPITGSDISRIVCGQSSLIQMHGPGYMRLACCRRCLALLTQTPALASALRRLREDRDLTREALAFHAGLTTGLARADRARAVLHQAGTRSAGSRRRSAYRS